MDRQTIIKLAQDAGATIRAGNEPSIIIYSGTGGITYEVLEKTVLAAVAVERKNFPNLQPVITWLENGCGPKEAAKELAIYQHNMRSNAGVTGLAPAQGVTK